TQYVALLVVLRVLPIRAGHILPRVEHVYALLIGRDLSFTLHRAMDGFVDLAARGIIRRHNQCPIRRAYVFAGDFAYAFLPVADLMHATLAVEIADGLAHFA